MTKLPITQVATSDLAQLLSPQAGRRMELPGFSEEFVDFPDYIIRITDRIWHERKIELCREYYTEDCVIHTMNGDICGAATVIENTHATLNAFPDRRLDADNVIWSDEGEGKFYSSHLITSKMTNLGPSEFGPPTGKKIRVRTIADCLCANNRIFEEWLVRDYASMVLQLGFDPDEIAKKLAKQDLEAGKSIIDILSAPRRSLHGAMPSEKLPDRPETQPNAFAAHILERFWAKAFEADLAQIYDFRACAQYPGQRNFYGHDEVGGHWSGFLNAFPNAEFFLEHIADIPYLGETRDIALRWTLRAEHLGDGPYGPASGAPIYILAVTHWRVINGKIKEEVTIWDDIALRRQIETARLQQQD